MHSYLYNVINKPTEQQLKQVASIVKNFIHDSSDYVTIPKIKQLHNIRKLELSLNLYTTFQIYKNSIYLQIESNELDTSYLLKFDNIYTAKYLAEELRFNSNAYKKLNGIDNISYNELEVEQDGYIYNIFITSNSRSGTYNISIVDNKSRIVIATYMNNNAILGSGVYVEKQAIERFALMKHCDFRDFVDINLLPNKIKEQIIMYRTIVELDTKA